MTIPVLMLLIFSMWTLALLVFTIGVYRWGNVLRGKAQLKDYKADEVQGSDWYKRAMRAHANCIENLPIFGVLVFAAYVSGLSSEAINVMSIVIVISRIAQSIIHVAFVQTNLLVLIRFCAFFTQIICFVGMAVIVLSDALSGSLV